MTMKASSWLTVFLLLAPPWVMFLVACYWLFYDNKPPVVIVYEHPKFVDREVYSRDDARKHEIAVAESGSFVWAYREMCTSKDVWGSARGYWIAGAFVWQTPERSVAPMELGCHVHSFNIRVPSTNPTRDFQYKVDWLFENNPLVTSTVRMTPISLRVLAPPLPTPPPAKMMPKPPLEPPQAPSGKAAPLPTKPPVAPQPLDLRGKATR